MSFKGHQLIKAWCMQESLNLPYWRARHDARINLHRGEGKAESLYTNKQTEEDQNPSTDGTQEFFNWGAHQSSSTSWHTRIPQLMVQYTRMRDACKNSSTIKHWQSHWIEITFCWWNLKFVAFLHEHFCIWLKTALSRGRIRGCAMILIAAVFCGEIQSVWVSVKALNINRIPCISSDPCSPFERFLSF